MNEIRIDMDRRCDRCGEPGATQAGICLACVAKAIGRRRPVQEKAATPKPDAPQPQVLTTSWPGPTTPGWEEKGPSHE